MGEYTAPIITTLGTIAAAFVSSYFGVQVAISNNEQAMILKKTEINQSNTFKALEIIKDKQAAQAEKWAMSVLKSQEATSLQAEKPDTATQESCAVMVLRSSQPSLPPPIIQGGDDLRVVSYILMQIIVNEGKRRANWFKSISETCKINIPDNLISPSKRVSLVKDYWEDQIKETQERVREYSK